MTTAQQQFDDTYISSGQICAELEVSRPTLTNARKRGLLPEPIVVAQCQVYLWKRDAIQPYLDAWKLMLRARRGQLKAEHSA